MKKEELSFLNSRGRLIYGFKTDRQCKSKALIVHGLSEHSGRYGELCRTLYTRGIQCYSMDLEGHGRSEGDRSLVVGVEELIADLVRFSELSGLLDSGDSRFIFGHSMGGLLSLAYLIKHQNAFDAACLSGTLIYPGSSIPPVLVKLSKPLSKWFPLARWAKLNPELIIKGKAGRAKRALDELVSKQPPPNITGLRLLQAAEAIQEQISSLSIPFKLIHGAEDRISHPRSSEFIFQQLSNDKKILNMYPELYHELIHEDEGEKIMTEIAEFFMTFAKPV